MRILKTLSLASFTLAMMVVCVSSALATTVRTGGGNTTPIFHFVNENGHTTLANPIANISCSGTLEGSIESHGTGVTAAGKFGSFSLTSCTNSWHVTSSGITPGDFEVHWTSGFNGLLTVSGVEFATTRLGVLCEYRTAETQVGTITGGFNPTIDIAATIPINPVTSSPLCGTGSAKWEGTYVGTSSLYIEK
ncbi:MAG TPA: hypothetical protein VFS54_10055 [Solirubrobacterales bacterium]|nr:hypothetical protein [Solirubrobacterales bacterium]